MGSEELQIVNYQLCMISPRGDYSLQLPAAAKFTIYNLALTRQFQSYVRSCLAAKRR